jgi:hypothetical protein
MISQDRQPTASERAYRKWLNSTTEEERAKFEGELVAICIVACRTKHCAPPYEWEAEIGRTYFSGQWTGGPFSLPSWVRSWVAGQLDGGKLLKDRGRYIGRRCVNTLIDQIRLHTRRRRGAEVRVRRFDDNPVEEKWSRDKVRRLLTQIGLPGKLPIPGDRKLFELLVAEYPQRLTNVAIARDWGVSEGAIRKRRKRISRVCFEIAYDNYLINVRLKRLELNQNSLTIVFKQLGLN